MSHETVLRFVKDYRVALKWQGFTSIWTHSTSFRRGLFFVS